MKVGIILVASTMALLASSCAEKQPSEGELFAQKALQSARDSMKDPTSVKFKDVRINVRSKCMYGKILGKNGYGAYSGYSDFAWQNGDMYVHQGASLDGTDSFIAVTEKRMACLKSMESVNHEEIMDIPIA